MLKSALAGLSRVANTLAIIANVAGTCTVLGLVVILNVDVIARSVFNAPLKGTYEIVQLAVVLIVFLQLADVVRVDRLTRNDICSNTRLNRHLKHLYRNHFLKLRTQLTSPALSLRRMHDT